MSYIGNSWPTSEQLLLLQAALCDEPEARAAWNKYAQTVDLQKADHASLSLLPLVYRNLKADDAPHMKLCKGKYRHTWCSNRSAWDKMNPLLTAWAAAGVEQIVLLKGMAMTLHWYRDFGVRVMGDIDLLVRKKHLPFIARSLFASGWETKFSRFDIENPDHLQRWHALNFIHPDGSHLDLHWSLIEENAHDLDAALFAPAIPLSPEKPWLSVLCPTDQLFQVCIHGVKPSPVPLIRWVADAMTLLKSAPIDEERLVFFAQRAHVCLPLSKALRFLSQTFGAPLSNATLSALEASPTLHLEAREHRALVRGRHILSGWYRFCLQRGAFAASRFFHLPKYLQLTARLPSLWHLPFYVPYWLCKRLARFAAKKLPS